MRLFVRITLILIAAWLATSLYLYFAKTLLLPDNYKDFYSRAPRNTTPIIKDQLANRRDHLLLSNITVKSRAVWKTEKKLKRYHDLKNAALSKTVVEPRKHDHQELEKQKAMILTNEDSVAFAQNEKHDFNLFLSDRLPLDRDIQDTRDGECKNLDYEALTSEASIVICFHNEAQSVLLRTVVSVINRSPANNLKEILLVDDASTLYDLGQALEAKLKNITEKASILRLPERQGLIRARLSGAHKTQGTVLVFLDSHCEVNVGWLEPLLSEIEKNESTAICPFIDIIHSDTLDYGPSGAVRGGFNWGLHFRWDSVPEKDLTQGRAVHPYVSPTMAGGLFAIDKRFFQKIGEYDAGMDIWGGENMDISFRIWLCGGQLKIAPCSRVGHIFRTRRPYGNDGKGDTQMMNSLRVARVWLDDYIEKFYDARPGVRDLSPGDLTERFQLKRDLKCHSFQWYIDNVYPEAGGPSSAAVEPAIIRYKGKVSFRHIASQLCLNTEFLVKNYPATIVQCDKKTAKRHLIYETEGSNALVMGTKLCLDGGSEFEGPLVAKCHFMGGSQAWTYSKVGESTTLMNPAKGLCLGVKNLKLMFVRCNDDDKIVKWQIL